MKGWHFLREDRRLGYGDERIVQAGKTYTVPKDKPLELCHYGLHASRRIIDALKYAPGPVISRVELLGETIHDIDKSVAYQRRVITLLDGSEILHKFARLCALNVVDLWDAPEIVIRYLKTGDESIRAAARDAAWAARDAAWAARTSAWTSAWAAWDIAWAAMDTARAAWTSAWAAWDIAWAATKDKQNRKLTAMCSNAISKKVN